MEALIKDIRFSWRSLIRKPGFTAVAVFSLALGIGANTTIFSIVNELLLRPLPVDEPGRVVAIYTTDEKSPGLNPLSHLNWKDYRDQSDAFSDVMGYDWAQMSVTTGGESRLVFGQMVSRNYFDALGVRAAIGRTFGPDEGEVLGASPVAVLSHRFYTRNLGGNPGALDEPLLINGRRFTAIGVAPPEFRGIDVGVQPELWVPMSMNREIKPDASSNWYEQRRGLFLFTLARLAPGVSIDQAQTQLDVIAERLEREYPNANEGRGVKLRPLAEATILPNARGGVVAGMALLTVIVGLVLLVACGNVSSLLLVRANERRKEIAIRLAIGAGRWKLIRQLLVESLMVAFLGAVLGLVLALVARNALLGFLPSLQLPITVALDFSLDAGVLIYTVILALVTGILFGLVPAIQASRPGLVAGLKDQGDLTQGKPRKLSARNIFVVAQMALSIVALLGTALFVRSLGAAQETDTGFESENLLALSFNIGLQGYEQPRGEQFFRDVVERVESLPGVATATVAQAGPLQPSVSRSVILAGRDSESDTVYAQTNAVGLKYFETLGIELVQGRTFQESDRQDTVPVVIVNETMAGKYWPDQRAVGQRFSFFEEEPVEIVGVVRDAKYNSLGEDPQPYIYEPLAQRYMTGLTLIAGTERDPKPILKTVEREIRQLDPELPLVGLNTVSDILGNALWAPRLGASLLAIFGLLALFLAAIGLYGVISFTVHQRRREIGLRMAMGAERRSVLTLVLRQGMGLVIVGLALGLLVAFFLFRLAASLLFVSPTDPVAFVGSMGVLLLAALLANLVPAIRATGVDLINVLRVQ